MTQLRWGVIGATSRIYRQRLRPAMEIGEGHVIVAEASRHDGSEEPYSALIGRDDVDAVYIPLPNSGHKPWILAALEAGKHVLCEKPLTLTAADTGEVYTAASRARRVVMEAYMWPHHPRARRVLDLVADGELGELRSIRSTFTYPADDPTDHRFDERGGGALFDVGIYCIGPALLAVNRDEVGVLASAIRNSAGADLSMTGFVDWGEGVGSSFDVSFEAPARRSLEVVGTEGILILPDFHVPGPEEPSQILITRRDESTRVVDVPGANPFVEMIDHFAAVIDEHERPVFGSIESIRLARVLDALHQASR